MRDFFNRYIRMDTIDSILNQSKEEAILNARIIINDMRSKVDEKMRLNMRSMKRENAKKKLREIIDPINYGKLDIIIRDNFIV